MTTDTQFGQYFRQCREAQGLSLREFCRRNGFDPAKISKLERGLLPPPKTNARLEAYADALRFPPDSAERIKLFQLARDAGKNQLPRLPRVVQHPAGVRATDLDHWANRIEARSTLPQLIRRLVHATIPPQHLLKVDFPAHEGIQNPGWDGTVAAIQGNAFVPTGLSVWELSTAQKVTPKANADFKKRTASLSRAERKARTYISLTPRKWSGKEQWCATNKTAAGWHDVRAYDASTLEQWLELDSARAVEVWARSQSGLNLGVASEGVEGIDQHWQNLHRSTNPPLLPEVFLASRSENITQLCDWCWHNSAPPVLALESCSPNDAIDFVAACYAALGRVAAESTDSRAAEPSPLSEQIRQALANSKWQDRNQPEVAALCGRIREYLTAKVLIARSLAAWHHLSVLPGRLLLLPEPKLGLESEALTVAVSNGHRVLVSSRRFSRPDQHDVKDLRNPKLGDLTVALRNSYLTFASHHAAESLPNVKPGDLATTPEAFGLNLADVDNRARHSGGSLAVLKRALSRDPSLAQPDWSKPDAAQDLIPFVLLGSWNETQRADREAIAKLSGKPDHENSQVLQRWLNAPDSPFMRVHATWNLVSHEDAWQLLAPYITRDDLVKFRTLVTQVLLEEEPAYKKPGRTNILPVLSGHELVYSPAIRSGLSETLALLGCKSSELFSSDFAPEYIAKQVVTGLLNSKTTWRQWASLSASGLLPNLAEASPDAFVSAVKTDLSKPKPVLQKIFTDQDSSPLFADCTHAGLLWSLEALAWSPLYLTQVTLLLARLHEIAPHGFWSNRPMHSLAEIFLPWHPHTTASVNKRVLTLKKMAKQHQHVTWDLLLQLLPNVRRVSSPTRKPLWLSWSLNWEQSVTRGEYWQYVAACVDLLLSMLEGNIERYLKLLAKINHLPNDAQHKFLARIEESLVPEKVGVADRSKLVDALRKAADYQRLLVDERQEAPSDHLTADDKQAEQSTHFSDSRKEGVCNGILCKLTHLLQQFEPENAVEKFLWLFKLGNRNRAGGESEEQHIAALREVHANGGLKNVLELAAKPGALAKEVGAVYVKAGLYDERDSIIPEMLTATNSTQLTFARGVVSSLFERQGQAWVTGLPLSSWTAQEAGMLLAFLRFDPVREDWVIAQRLGAEVEKTYWQKVQTISLGRGAEREDLSFVARSLLKHGRTREAVMLLDYAIFDKVEPAAGLVMAALEALAATKESVSERYERGVMLDDAERLIRYLQKNASGEITGRLENIEWQYLRLIGWEWELVANLATGEIAARPSVLL